MAVCVASVSGTLSVTGTAIGSCTDYVLYTAAEYAVLSPQLTPVEVAQLSMSVLLSWAIAWGFKILRRTL
jgi:hypothetical protein